VTAVAPEDGAPPRTLPHAGPTADDAWFRACVEAFGLEPHVVEVHGARAPLVLERGRLTLPGTVIVGEPMDFGWRNEEALERLAAEVAATGLPLRLFRLPSASPALAALRRHFPLVVERPAGACPVLRIEDEPERVLSSRRRQDLRRARRRAEQLGTLAVEVHEPAPAEVDGLLDVAFSVEARSWKGRDGTALAQDRRRARFYRTYCRDAAAAGALRIALLTLDGLPAATQIAVERDDALWLLKIGYDEAFASCSPGQLLMQATLQWAVERGLRRYELLGLAKPWTRMWTRDEWPSSLVLAYPATVRGLRAAVPDGLRALRTTALETGRRR
jgi:hypothetical protein